MMLHRKLFACRTTSLQWCSLSSLKQAWRISPAKLSEDSLVIGVNRSLQSTRFLVALLIQVEEVGVASLQVRDS
jgi:hypothetical protein